MMLVHTFFALIIFKLVYNRVHIWCTLYSTLLFPPGNKVQYLKYNCFYVRRRGHKVDLNYLLHLRGSLDVFSIFLSLI